MPVGSTYLDARRTITTTPTGYVSNHIYLIIYRVQRVNLKMYQCNLNIGYIDTFFLYYSNLKD